MIIMINKVSVGLADEVTHSSPVRTAVTICTNDSGEAATLSSEWVTSNTYTEALTTQTLCDDTS